MDSTLVGQTMSSAEFRRRYASLTVPTIVTVNGHTIGVWVPGADGTVALSAEVGDDFIRNQRTTEVKAVAMTQGERDAILRRINKGG